MLVRLYLSGIEVLYLRLSSNPGWYFNWSCKTGSSSSCTCTGILEYQIRILRDPSSEALTSLDVDLQMYHTLPSKIRHTGSPAQNMILEVGSRTSLGSKMKKSLVSIGKKGYEG